jgi:hypothetical protein
MLVPSLAEGPVSGVVRVGAARKGSPGSAHGQCEHWDHSRKSGTRTFSAGQCQMCQPRVIFAARPAAFLVWPFAR